MLMNIERFQSNDINTNQESLDSAYSDKSLNIVSRDTVTDLGADTTLEENNNNNNTTPEFHQHIELEESKMNFNIWDILGISNLSKDKQNCMMDCGIKSLNELDKCNEQNYLNLFKNSEYKCRVKSYKKALECSKKCYNLDEDTVYETPNNLLNGTSQVNNNITSNVTTKVADLNVPTTSSLDSLNALKLVNDIKNTNTNIQGISEHPNTYSPFESKYWPNESNFGWDIEQIKNYNNNIGDEVIEVRATQFFPATTQKPYLEFGNDGYSMLLHEVE